MVPLVVLLTTLLIQFTCGYNDKYYPETSYPSLEDFHDDDELPQRRNNNFLRFGRADLEDEDFDEDFARPTRSSRIEKNDHFIRFGRNPQHFLRFGRDHRHYNTSSYLRLGRSVEDEKKRSRRSASNDFKRGGKNYLRFGRNNNFLRFGRNEKAAVAPEQQIQDSPLIQLLEELVESIKKTQNSV